MKKFLSIFVLINLLLVNQAFAKPVQKKNYSEIREMQTRTFETSNKFLVMKSVINTLQDNGFIIQNIEDSMGYIRAKKEVKLKRTHKGRVTYYSTLLALNATALGLSFGLNPMAAYGMIQDSMAISSEVAPHTVIFDTNVFIEPFGKYTKVRFSVIEKELENSDGYTTVKASPRKVVRHYEQDLYQEFFNQVSKNLFLEKV